MQLVSALAEGVSGADGGTAELYLHSDDSRAVYYLDHNGRQRISSGLDIDLDPYGAAVVYVNGLVRVVVKDQSGSTVRAFVDGHLASAGDYVGPSMFGFDYVTQDFSATGGPLNLRALFSRWGSLAPDWEVSAAPISDIFTGLDSILGVRASVKAFGALGDGAADDAIAIGKTIAYVASLGGGTAYFPPGNYLVTKTTVLPSGVRLLGSRWQKNKGAAVLASGGLETVLSVQSAVSGSSIEDIYVGFTSPSLPVGPIVVVAPGSKFSARNATVQAANGVALSIASDGIRDDATEVQLIDSKIYGPLVSIADHRRTRPSALPMFRRLRVIGTVESAYGTFDSCVFELVNQIYAFSLTQNRAMASTLASTSENARLVVSRCVFPNGLAAAMDALPSTASSDGALVEDFCTFGGSVAAYSEHFTSRRPNGVYGSSASRVSRITDNNNRTLSSAGFHTTIVTRTSTAASILIIGSASDGEVRRLFVHNNSGGTLTQTVRGSTSDSGDFPVGAAGVSMLNGTWRLWEWVQWPLATVLNEDGVNPEAHFACICDGVAVGSPA